MVLIIILIFLLPFFWNSYFSILFFICLITFNSIILYFLGVYFISLSLILVYSGAIPILIIFLIKLLSDFSRNKKYNFYFIMFFQLIIFFKSFLLISVLINCFFWSKYSEFSELYCGEDSYLNSYYLYDIYFNFNISDYLLKLFNINLFLKPGLSSIDLIVIKDFFYGCFFFYFFICTILLLIAMVGSITIILLPKK